MPFWTITANRILAKMTDDGKIQKIRIGKSWGYIVIQKEDRK